jgi:hypothetical protein
MLRGFGRGQKDIHGFSDYLRVLRFADTQDPHP